MRTFVDTSALYALLDEDDHNHNAARTWFLEPGHDLSATLSTHNYVILEAAELIRSRLPFAATRIFFDAFVPMLSVLYVDKSLHERAVGRYVSAARRRASLVDHVSFEAMRDLGLSQAFAFDRDFATEGFDLVPA